jgi:hypothetical protein
LHQRAARCLSGAWRFYIIAAPAQFRDGPGNTDPAAVITRDSRDQLARPAESLGITKPGSFVLIGAAVRPYDGEAGQA